MVRLEDYNKGLVFTEVKGCIECNKCIHECPILKSNVAVMDSDGSYKMCVDQKECVLCGTCIDTCVHEVRHFRDDCEDFLLSLKQGKSISVLVAPAFYVNYPDEYKNIMGYLKSLGVKNFYPVSFGADITTWAYLNYLAKNDAVGNVAQPCPSIVCHIERHEPKLLSSLIPVQSPMMCTAIYLKRYKGIEDDLAFLGPCIAKRAEITSKRGLGLIQHNITFKNLLEHIRNKDVNLQNYPAVEEDGSYGLGSLFPMPGGLRENVEYYLGPEASIIQVDGERKAYKYLKTFASRVDKKKDTIPLLVDIMNCEMGCCYGTGTEFRLSDDDAIAYRAIAMRKKKHSTMKAHDLKMPQEPAGRFAHMNEAFKELKLEDFLCEYTDDSLTHTRVVSEAEIQAILMKKLMKLSDNDKHVDCSACGYKTCHHMAEAIAYGINHHDNCVYYIQQSKLEAENASKAKSDFLSKMSHEIRTPLNAIMGMAELILHENISTAARDQAATIKQSGDHLLSIINDILDLSKVESGKLEIMNADYLFHSTIHDVISIIKMRMTGSDLRFAAYMQHDIPNELFGDEVRIRQALLNILANALKYTKKGFFSLDVTSKKESEDSIMLTMKIKDTGIGIKQEDMGKLFGEFTQFDLEKNRNVEGSGLGLAITHNLITLMGGKIEVSSTYGEGSEFTIHLPQKLSKRPEADTGVSVPHLEDKNVLLYGRTPIYTEYTARALKDLKVNYHIVDDDSELHNKLLERTWDYVFAEEDLAVTAIHITYTRKLETKVVLMSDTYVAKSGQEFIILIMPAYFLSITNILSGRDIGYLTNTQHMEHFIAPDARILLVDDINTNLKVGKGLLKQYEVRVDLCTNGKEAIEAVASVDYDMVLMDHMMPEMDGVEAANHIREFSGEKYARLPIIALTANAIVGAREMFLQSGFNDFLSKPIDTVKLNSILAKWLPKEKQKPIAAARVTTSNEELPIAIEIEDVDTAKGMTFSGGSLRNYLDVLKVFHQDGLTKTSELLNSLENNNLSLYTIHVHALKSAAANIGADRLSEDAKILEAAGKKLDLDFIKKHNGALVDNLKKVLASIGEVISAHAETLDREALNNGVLKSLLAELKTALESFDVNAIDEASLKLQDFTQLPGTGETLSELLQNAFVGKYKQAAAQIETILRSLD